MKKLKLTSSKQQRNHSAIRRTSIIGMVILAAVSSAGVWYNVRPLLSTQLSTSTIRSTSRLYSMTSTSIPFLDQDTVPQPPIHFNGTWVGNNWMPSSSAATTSSSSSSYHLYTPEQLANYWKDESVLFLGDSTARRLYATMYELIYHGSGSGSDGNDGNNMDRNKVKYPHDLRVENLNAPSIIDVNKKVVTEVCDRVIANGTYPINGNGTTYSLCRNMPGSSSSSIGTSTSSGRFEQKKRRFDIATIICNSQVTEWFHPPSSGGGSRNGDGDNGDGDNDGGVLWRGLHGGDIYDYTVIVIAIGPWELIGSHLCPTGRLNNTQSVVETFELYAEYVAKVEAAAAAAGSSSSTSVKIPPRIVWRTWAGLGQDNNKFFETHQYADQMNTYMKKHMDDIQMKQWQQHATDGEAIDGSVSSSSPRAHHSVHSVSYVDYGHILKPRSFPVNVRIKGDVDVHVGFEARHMMIQALTNHLVEQDRQLLHGIPPWSVYSKGISTTMNEDEYDEYHCHTASPYRREEYCSPSFSSQQVSGEVTATTSSHLVESIDDGKARFFDIKIAEPPLSAEEQAQYDADQQRYCGQCIWNGHTTCEMRLMYLQQTYGGSRHFHLHGLLEKSQECINKEQ